MHPGLDGMGRWGSILRPIACLCHPPHRPSHHVHVHLHTHRSLSARRPCAAAIHCGQGAPWPGGWHAGMLPTARPCLHSLGPLTHAACTLPIC